MWVTGGQQDFPRIGSRDCAERRSRHVLIYRFRFRSGQAAFERDHQFRDDLDALDAAIGQSDTSDVEIWHEGKLIARVKKGNAPLTERDRVSG